MMKRIALLIILLVLFNAACAAPSTIVPTQPPPTTQPTSTPTLTPPTPAPKATGPGATSGNPTATPQAASPGDLKGLAELGEVRRDVTYCTADGVALKMDVYLPKTIGTLPFPVAVYVHGGGWTGGDKSGVSVLDVTELIRRGYLVASVNYRLAPQFKFPAQIEDVKCAVRYLRANRSTYNLDPNRIGVWGGSAGGHLVALLGTTDASARLEGNGGWADQSSRVQAVVDLFGPADLTGGFGSAMLPRAKEIFGATSPQDPVLATASPVTHITKDDPPFLILHGDKDETVPLKQSEILYERLKAAGVPATLVVVKNAEHGFTQAGGPINPSRVELTKMIADFFDQHLKKIAASPKPSQATPPCNAILIGWDGAQRDHVKQALARGELPNLQKLGSEGALVDIDIIHTTDTKAGWAQILTGYNPEVTGVYSNGHYQPIPSGYTVFERLEAAFGPEQFVTVAVIGKKGNVDAEGPTLKRLKAGQKAEPGAQIITQDGKQYVQIPGKPYYYTQNSMDVFINGLVEDEVVGAKALELLDKYKDKPFFFFVHLAEVDHNGHRYGENSKEYNDALISADTWTGKIVDKLKQLNLYDKTSIYVTADHGFDEGMTSHKNAPYVFLATNDRQVSRPGMRFDIAPTILQRFGLDLSKIKPPLSGRPLTGTSPAQ